MIDRDTFGFIHTLARWNFIIIIVVRRKIQRNWYRIVWRE